MSKSGRNLLKVTMALILTVLISFPVSGFLIGSDDPSPVLKDELNGKDIDGIEEDLSSLEERSGPDGLIELSDDETRNLERYLGRSPTRSEPWMEWQRYSYHRGGEEGLVAYQNSENRLFIYGGGYASWSNQQGFWSYNGYDDLFIYDFDDEKWYALERYNSPGGRFGFSYAVDEDSELFYIYGGLAGSMMDDLWEFDMNTLQWNQISSAVFGSYYGRRAHAPMVLDTTGENDQLYIHMGMKDDQYNYYVENHTGFFRIDLSNPTATPTQLADGWNDGQGGLKPRYHHSMCIDETGRKIYIYGGQHMTNRDYSYLDDFWQYDIISGTWSELTREPTMPLNYGASIFFRSTDDKVYLWGGRENESSTVENLTLWSYDTTIGSWDWHHYDDPGTDVPNGRLLYHHHYSADGDKFFSFGGRYYYTYYGRTRSSRFRDISYLTLSSKTWTMIPTISNPSTNSGGIFAYEKDQGKLHYIGPSTYSGTAYTYYWDLSEEKWYGPFYNTGDDNPHSRSDAGMCYDPENNTVFIYGGGYTDGWGNNREYYDLADMWMVDLDTSEWTKLWDPANPGPRFDFDMVWNDIDGKVYFFGGRRYHEDNDANPRVSRTVANDDFYSYKYDPDTNGIFQPILTPGKPEPRYGAGAVFVSELNKMYVTCGKDPDPENVRDFRDLWEYDFSVDKWTELESLTSPMISPKLDFDPLVREIYLTGGSDYVIKRYRILEDEWYTIDPDVNPGTMNQQAHIFIPETRDLWVYGGGIKPGIWKIGIPYRLAIQDIYFKDPETGVRDAYSMLRPYTFGTVIKTVNGEQDLKEASISMLHTKGTFRVVYNHTEESFTEIDDGDHAELVDTSLDWNDNVLTMEISVKFHWNFTSKGNEIDKRISVDAKGFDVAPDFLEIKGALNVRNDLEIVNDPVFEGEIQGELEKGDWVKIEEGINLTGPYVKYVGRELYPPEDSYNLMLSEGQYTPNNDNILLTTVYRTWDLDITPGEPLDFSFNAPNRTYSNVTYILNMTGVSEDDLQIYREFWLSSDGEAPAKPSSVLIHADSEEDSQTAYDNDAEVYLSWMGSGASESGIETFYWSFEDNGGTRDGNPVTQAPVSIELPSNGTQTVFIWAEDRVGNIGMAANRSILIDTNAPQFRVLKPDLDQLIPYQELEVEVNLSDMGGSRLNSYSLQYRFTNDGQNSDDMWTGENAWKEMSDLWTDFPKNHMEFTIFLGKDTPDLTDSDENYLQFKVRDHAGNEIESEIYNIMVDVSLRFPMVTLGGPEEGEVFENAEYIELNWTLDFFMPEDVKYELYIDQGDEGRVRVQNKDPSIMIELIDNVYYPEFVDHGTWYWTVIPVAQEKWEGNSTNGIKSFFFKDEESFSFEVTGPGETLVREMGQAGIPIQFDIINTGGNKLVIEKLTYDLKGVGSLQWSGDPSLEVDVGGSKTKIANLDISPSTPVGNYTLVFHFNSTRTVKRMVEVQLRVVEARDDGGDGDGEDTNDALLYLIFGAIGVILILIIIAVIYFTVIKKSDEPEVKPDDNLDELEEELSGSGGQRIAPQPTGITSTVSSGSVASSEGSSKEGEPSEEVPGAEKPQQQMLAEEGSDDDWMNLVANETMTAEGQPEVEEDKTRHDEGKSLQDLLSDMSAGVEDD